MKIFIFLLLEVIVFLLSLLLSKVILNVFQKNILKKQYEITIRFRYFISMLITLLVGIAAGKMIIGNHIV